MSCEKNFCQQVFVPQIEAESKQMHSKLAKTLKIKMKYKPMTKKLRKMVYDGCVKVHCNPSCVGTIFNKYAIDPEQKKALNKMPAKERAEIMKLAKYMQDVQRKQISKYNPPLKDGFYRGLKATNIKTLKNSGAKSACTTILSTQILRKVPKIINKTIRHGF